MVRARLGRSMKGLAMLTHFTLLSLLMSGCTNAVAAKSEHPTPACEEVWDLATAICVAEVSNARALVDVALEHNKAASLFALGSPERAHALQMVDAEYRHAQAVSRICNALVGIK